MQIAPLNLTRTNNNLSSAKQIPFKGENKTSSDDDKKYVKIAKSEYNLIYGLLLALSAFNVIELGLHLFDAIKKSK